MVARVSGRNLCYAEAVRTVGRNVDRWIFRTQVATPYRSEGRELVSVLLRFSSIITLDENFSRCAPWFSPRSAVFARAPTRARAARGHGRHAS